MSKELEDYVTNLPLIGLILTSGKTILAKLEDELDICYEVSFPLYFQMDLDESGDPSYGMYEIFPGNVSEPMLISKDGVVANTEVSFELKSAYYSQLTAATVKKVAKRPSTLIVESGGKAIGNLDLESIALSNGLLDWNEIMKRHPKRQWKMD